MNSHETGPDQSTPPPTRFDAPGTLIFNFQAIPLHDPD